MVVSWGEADIALLCLAFSSGFYTPLRWGGGALSNSLRSYISNGSSAVMSTCQPLIMKWVSKSFPSYKIFNFFPRLQCPLSEEWARICSTSHSFSPFEQFFWDVVREVLFRVLRLLYGVKEDA